MRLQVFIGFMVCSAVVIAVGSYMTGATVGVSAFRGLIALFVLQVVYVLLLVLMSLISPPKPARPTPDKTAQSNPAAAKTQKQ